ncbi:hypothetical protein ISS42_02045 [Candidatus Shapirobacteria bacterium]|nr:hypothetical protein [Candidatus Shapirobacteria bacterium]
MKKKRISLRGFPEILVTRPTDGGLVSVKGLLQSHYDRQTEFNHAVITFSEFFESMRNSTLPVEERWATGRALPSRLIVLADDPTMDEITVIANTPGAYENHELKKQYRDNLERVMQEIKEKGKLNPEATVIGIKRAGEVAVNMLHGPDKALLFEAKRLPFRNGSLGVGIEDKDRVLGFANLNGKVVEINEVFLASGATVLAFIIDCHSRGIKPERMDIVAPFTTQQGAEAVLSLSSQIGWETRIIVNRIYYSLNGKWYVLVTPQEKIWQKVSGGNAEVEVQAGGDAGDLTEIS